MDAPTKIPAITRLITEGYGPGMLATVIESLRWMAMSLRQTGNLSESDEANILNLLLLEEAVLKDCFGIDLNELF